MSRAGERIAKDFAETERNEVAELLDRYQGPESDRVRWDILQLSRGQLNLVRTYLEIARTDYRDILYWAEYYETDPLVRGRDPKQFVEELLAKLKEKKSG